MNKSELPKLMLVMAFAVIMTSGPLSAFADEDFESTLSFSQVQQPNPGASPLGGASGTATLSLTEGGAGDPQLSYFIQLYGIDIDGLQTANPKDDLTGLHIHVAAHGSNGPHVFNILSEPCDDDTHVPEFSVDPVAGTIQGIYDDTAISTVATCGVVPGADGISKPLSNFLTELKNEEFYFQVHTDMNKSPNGELRGQITSSPLVGGELLSIDSTALVLAGIQSSAIWILPVLAGVAGTGAYFIRTRMNRD